MRFALEPSVSVLAEGLRFPEGPAFDGKGNLWVVEYEGGSLARVSRSGEIVRYRVGGSPNGIAFYDDRIPWFCDAERCEIRRLQTDGRAETVTTDAQRRILNRPNDLAFDRDGHLVFTCPGDSREEPTGSVWRLSNNGELSIVASDLLFPNGLAFSADGSMLVIAETYAHRLWRGDWCSESGKWEGKPWLRVGGPIGPDGMAFNNEGTLFVAIFGKSRIAMVDTEGHLTSSIGLHGARPTNVAFDPTGSLGLVVTEAELGQVLSIRPYPIGARLFRGAAAPANPTRTNDPC